MKLHRTLGVGLALACLTSCGGSGTDEASPAAARTPEASSSETAASATVPASQPSRGVAAIRACEIVTPPEVASIVGGTLLNEPPPGFPNCAYVLDVSGQTESYRLVFAEPDLYEALLATQSGAEKGERLDGLLDEAWVQQRDTGGYAVIALRHGNLAVEAWGDRREPAIEIAKLAVSRAP